MISDMLAYAASDMDRYLLLIGQHIYIDLIAIAICIAISVPLGYLSAKRELVSNITMAIANLLLLIPSIALFALLQPVFGIGNTTAIIGLIVFGIPPLVASVRTGIKSVDPCILENARGMGMEKWRICLGMELPLAIPTIINGIRVTTVSLISGTTIAAYIGAGGLGVYITLGLNTSNYTVMCLGAATVAILAILVDLMLAGIQKRQLKKIH